MSVLIEARRKLRLKRVRKSNKIKKRKTDLSTKGFAPAKKGKRGFKSGHFRSVKNKKDFIYRSAYELAFYNILESDLCVLSYEVEPFSLPYTYAGRKHKYFPDLIVMYKSGDLEVIEIKPTAFVKDGRVQAKARACRKYIAKNIANCKFKFVTEKDIFETEADYKTLIKALGV